MKKVCFMIYDMGAGHRSSANALKEVIEQRKLPWKIEVIEVFKDIFGMTFPQYFYNNLALKKSGQELFMILYQFLCSSCKFASVIWLGETS